MKPLHIVWGLLAVILLQGVAEAEQVTLHYTYDDAQRLQSVVYGITKTASYQYDLSGNCTNRIYETGTSPLNDSDANGLYDLWEISFFGSTGNDPDADPDGDGFNNAQESFTWTNPQDQTSYLSIEQASFSASLADLAWSTVPYRQYRVWWSTAVSQWSTANSAVTTNGTWTDVSGPHERIHYRITAE